MIRSILASTLLLAAACASAVPAPPSGVKSGLEVFVQNPPEVVRGKRVGLITNHSAVDAQRTSAIDLLHQAEAFDLVALFSPEHGIRGAAQDGVIVESGVDQRTGLPIHSLYGETRKPTPGMLRGVDALVFDIQDIGARQYTYISTLGLAMQAAAEQGIPLVVLDRPNPIGGRIVEGNILDPRFATFVGMYPIASRHGMTVGELARLFNGEYGFGTELVVVRAEGWERSQWQDETGLPWVNPSPNMRSLEAATHYPGMVFIEGTNLSEGRGTDLPFHQAGAPWLRAEEVADSMNALGLPGVRFQAVRFSIDSAAAKHPGQTVPGVRLLVTDRERYRPLEAALRMIDLIRRLHPRDFRWAGEGRPDIPILHLDRLAGTDRLRHAIEGGTLPRLLEEWSRDAERFRRLREPYLLYR